MKNPFRTRVRLLLPLLLLVPMMAQGAARQTGSEEASDSKAQGVTVLLVRHAETAGSTRTERDPALSSEGRARAEALRDLLAHTGVTHLFCSEYRRTKETLTPLAELLALEPAVVPAREAAAQIARLRELPAGAVAVVAGHSNTVPGLVAELGGRLKNLESGPGGPAFPHSAYDRLAVVFLGDSEAAGRTLELRYGAAE